MSRLQFLNRDGKFVEQRLKADERPTKLFYFFVTGHGPFPFDMLRKDRAWPASESDAGKLHRKVGAEMTTRVTIEMRSLSEPMVERWASFGWIVTCYEVIPDAGKEARTLKEENLS